MYSVGDLIVYGRTGVCRVEEVKSLLRPGDREERLCYVLRPLYQTCTITTPVENAAVPSRPILSRRQAEELIDIIPGVEAEAYHNRNLTKLREYYNERLSCLDCRGLVEMIKSIYRKQQEALALKRKLGAVDERFWREAEGLLYGELAASLGIRREEVPDLIARRAREREETQPA